MSREIKIIIFLAIIEIYFVSSFNVAFAFPINTPVGGNSNFNKNSVDNLVNKVLEGFSPQGAKNILSQPPVQNTNRSGDTSISPKSVFNLGELSTGSIIDALKAIGVLMIKLFLVAIQAITDILRALLGAISTSGR